MSASGRKRNGRSWWSTDRLLSGGRVAIADLKQLPPFPKRILSRKQAKRADQAVSECSVLGQNACHRLMTRRKVPRLLAVGFWCQRTERRLHPRPCRSPIGNADLPATPAPARGSKPEGPRPLAGMGSKATRGHGPEGMRQDLHLFNH